jgi:ribose transport system substrate-binding protein
VPYLAFTQDNFEAELPNIPQGSVASHEYTQDDAVETIKANMK